MPDKTKVVMGVIVALLVLLGLTLPATVNSQISPTLTPTPMPYPLLFVQDDCVPPCWFGLTPGTSDSEEVEAVLAAHPDIFWDIHIDSGGELNLDTDLLVNGIYKFYVGFGASSEPPPHGAIVIRDNLISTIVIEGSIPITLEQVLEVFGPPDWVLFDKYNTMILASSFSLGYQEMLLNVKLTPLHFDRNGEKCNTSSLYQDLGVYLLAYYSPAIAQRIPRGFFCQPGRPIFGCIYDGRREVPMETWEVWLNGEVEMNCEEAWEQLPQVASTPSPTQTIIRQPMRPATP